MLVIQQQKHKCESPDPNHVALRTNDLLEKIVQEVNGQQVGVKEKPALEKLGGEENKKQIESSFGKQDHS